MRRLSVDTPSQEVDTRPQQGSRVQQPLAAAGRTQAIPPPPPPPPPNVAPMTAPPSPASLIDLIDLNPLVTNPLYAQQQQQQQQLQFAAYMPSSVPPPPPPPTPSSTNVLDGKRQYDEMVPPSSQWVHIQQDGPATTQAMPLGDGHQNMLSGASPMALGSSGVTPIHALSQPSELLVQPFSLPLQLMLPPLPRGPKPLSVLEAEGVQLVLKAEAGGELQVMTIRYSFSTYYIYYHTYYTVTWIMEQVRYPFLYSNVDALTLADVRQLLVLYKELVLKYEATAQVRISLSSFILPESIYESVLQYCWPNEIG